MRHKLLGGLSVGIFLLFISACSLPTQPSTTKVTQNSVTTRTLTMKAPGVTGAGFSRDLTAGHVAIVALIPNGTNILGAFDSATGSFKIDLPVKKSYSLFFLDESTTPATMVAIQYNGKADFAVAWTIKMKLVK